MPSVTVVIPTFGRPQLVCRAVRSVLAQTMADHEIIVVIDGDDPATREALGTIGDPRLRWISHDGKRGAGQARDTGAEAAAGDWVAFLDDDDEWLPEKLERQLAAVPADGRAVVMALSRVVSRYGTFIRPATPYDGRVPIDEWLFDRHSWTRGGDAFLQTSSLMMPRALFDVLKFTDTKQHEEWELVIRAVKQHGYALVTPPDPLVIYYVPENRNSLSRSYTWRQSILWAEGMGDVLTKRAFSGFCLTVVAQMAATFGAREAFGPLRRAAYAHGSPTPKQLFAFLYFRYFPTGLRWRLRAMVQGERSGA
ncbi:glycosyltransferase family 2 protein [Sphingomonas sp. VNH70]|uniref:glycosyltransferase family 2 protein n=1 Tax=Sphingomonas silueang TaxID=3156617 RepID=UPI0032B50B1F